MIQELYCPYCKADYNTIACNTIKCMNCQREYPVDNWPVQCELANRKHSRPVARIFMIWKDRVYVIEVPDNCNPWEYARKRLGVKEEDITPWGECRLENGVACFNYKLGYSEACW